MPIKMPSNPPLIKPRVSSGGLSSRGVDEDFNQLLNREGTQGSTGGGSLYVPTDDPFLSLARLHLHEDPYAFYDVCKWLSVNSLVHKAYVFNMSLLPMTEPDAALSRVQGTSSAKQNTPHVLGDPPRKVNYQDYIKKTLNLHSFNKKVARVFHTYSAAVAMLRFPFVKRASCAKCGGSFRVKEMIDWSVQDGKFYGACPLCNASDAHVGYDHYVQQAANIQLFCPEMTDIRTLKRSPASDAVDIYYLIPDSDARRIRSGDEMDRDFVLETPQPFLEAVLGNRKYQGWGERCVVKLRPDHCHLIRSEHTACGETGLPYPAFLGSFEPTWLCQVLGKATQAICKQYAVPMTAIFPETSSRASNLFEMINVGTYMQVLQREIAKHGIDQTYRMVLPFPVGSQVIGGEAKSVFYAQEARVMMELIAASLNCPLEFIFGGLSYSGSDVSVNNVEKQMESTRDVIVPMDQWVSNAITDYMDWDRYDISLGGFTLGSDLPKNQFYASLAASNQLPAAELHRSMGVKTEAVREGVIRDVQFEVALNRTRMESEARVQADMGIQQATAQAEGQIEGQFALITKGADLQQRIRGNPELYNYVMQNPQLAAQIFAGSVPTPGPAYPPGEAPMPVDPAQVAPSGVDSFPEDAEDQIEPEGLRQLVLSGESLVGSGAEPDAGLVAQLVMSFEDVPPESWPEGIEAIRQDYGPEMATEVNRHLMLVRSMQGQRATRAAGVRDEVNDYGNPGVA